MILKRCFLQWNGSEACSKGKSRAFVLKSNYVTILVFFFPRMKRGTDQEALLLGTIMPTITCDIFPPADILNRILSEFMTSRPLVAYNLTPTIFKVNSE